jgi:hypothetical protein
MLALHCSSGRFPPQSRANVHDGIRAPSIHVLYLGVSDRSIPRVGVALPGGPSRSHCRITGVRPSRGLLPVFAHQGSIFTGPEGARRARCSRDLPRRSPRDGKAARQRPLPRVPPSGAAGFDRGPAGTGPFRGLDVGAGGDDHVPDGGVEEAVIEQPNQALLRWAPDPVLPGEPGPDRFRCEVSGPVSRNGSGSYATSRALRGRPVGFASAPNSLLLSCRARWVRSTLSSCVIWTVSPARRTPTVWPR